MDSNVGRPIQYELYGSSKYFMILIDDCIHISWVFCHKCKSDSSITLAVYLNPVERQFVKRLRECGVNNEGKYITNEFKDFLLTSGIIYEVIPSHSPESNRIAEPFNQHINIIVRSMTISSTDFRSL
jgi:hypothetical protein